jgi:DNA-binding MarR family transcriptional regulator
VSASLPLANALRDISWLLPRTLGQAPSPTAAMPRSEVEVMRLLVRRPGLSVNEAAAELGLQPPNLSTAVRALVARGELERRPDPDDGRIVRLHPTEKALAVRAAQELAWGRALDHVLAELEPGDHERLLAAAPALAALVAALAEQAEQAEQAE